MRMPGRHRGGGDAFGQALYDALHRQGRGYHVVERDDGMVDALETKTYFAAFAAWPAGERQAIRLARGRVLDIGCGAGRHALYLQRRGLDVTGTDISALAIRVCRERGLRKARVAAVHRIPLRWGPFDAILMLGNNFGLVGNRRKARVLLRRFARMAAPDAILLAGSRDPYLGAPAEHRRYQRRNRRAGRMGGQIRLRARYRSYATPWIEYLLVSREEMRMLVEGTGWRIRRFLPARGQRYVGVLARAG